MPNNASHSPLATPLGSRAHVYVATIVLAAITLLLTARHVFDPVTQAKYALNGDILTIARFAKAATGQDIVGWWTGGWIEESIRFYRPLSSMLFWTEYRLWGEGFESYCIVSWVTNAAITCLLMLLCYRLSSPGTWRGLIVGFTAGVLLNVRNGPVGGPEWTGERLTMGLMPYWPAQTDLFSLLFSLLSLLALDRYLTAPVPEDGRRSTRRQWLITACVLYVAALLFKEMAVSVALLATALAIYRRHPGWPRILAMYAAPVAAILAVRQFLVPAAVALEYKDTEWVLLKVARYASQQLTSCVGAGVYWPFGAAAGCIILATWLVRRRVSVVYVLLGLILWCGLCAQVLGGNFALITVDIQLVRLAMAAMFLGGLVVLCTSHSRLLWMLTAWLVAIHIPILHVWGPHYLYWPAAFWGLLNANLLNSACEKAVAALPKLKL